MRSLCLLGACALMSLGCKSAVEKCREAQVAAAEAWGAYANAIQADLDTARAAQTTAQTKLTTLQKRLSAQAEKAADARYARSDNAWVSAFEIARTTACSNDDECLEARRTNEEAKARAAELAPRLASAREAEKAAQGDPAKARTASEAMEMDYEYAQMKPARAAGAAADEQCQGVTLPADE